MPPSTAHLFHPKKKPYVARPPLKKDGTDTNNAKGSPSSTPNPNSSNNNAVKPRPRVPRPKPKEDDDDLRPPPPEGPYQEFQLVSSALNGWKYDVMKFDSRKDVEISTWAQPVKLNRKELRREVDNGVTVAAPQPVGPMLGPDGKPVIGADGRMVMVDADGKPIKAGDTSSATTNGAATPGPSSQGDSKGKEKEKSAAKKKFQKKTKQVFIIPEETRQLRREERYPWVMEDAEKAEVWLGKMEEVSKSETHAMFMPASNELFKFVPAHRWYKFQKKPNYHIPNLEEAETLMTQIQKNKDPERWLLRNRNGQAASESTVAMFKSERGLSAPPPVTGSLVYSAGQSLGPGGRRLKTVDSGGGGLFGDDDEEDGVDRRRKRERELGAEGDLEELDFEEDFADDEEKVEADGGDDEEMKEMEERLKRAYKSANKIREGYIDESDEDEDEGPKLSGAGRDMRKLMKKLEKGAYDDSDDEKNPYASSEEEEEEEEPPQVPTGPAIQPHEPRAISRSASQGPGSGTKTPTPSQATPGGKQDTGSRATSPAAPPTHGGHSIVAKRATSPKAPKLKGSAPSRAGSPLAPSGTGSRATSPVTSGSGVRAESPPQGSVPPTLKPSNKRKATDEPTSPTQLSGDGVKAKKRKAQAGEPAVSGELGEPLLIEWLRNTPGATTRDCIQYFTPWLKTEEKKQNFTRLVKEVATLKNGVLVLRNAYRNAAGTGGTPAAAG